MREPMIVSKALSSSRPEKRFIIISKTASIIAPPLIYMIKLPYLSRVVNRLS